MIQLIFIALLQVAGGTPETAPADASAAQMTTPAAQQESSQQPERRRCRREQLTGSRLSTRVCTTSDQDERNAENARVATERFQSQMPLQGN